MLAAQETLAQQTSLERVEITGSAIRRVDAETALPVVVIQRADIERSGATSVVDLMQRLPAIQGSTGESASVGGETFGFSGISVHDLGESRTLVLLNGHRMAIFGGQTLTGFAAGFDLNALPIAAIERVEVLTDGASALYGSDAVAGVVNFITKRGTTEGQVSVGYSSPKGGAKETRFSVTKGIGDLDKDGWNILGSYAHDERTLLRSTSRDYASTGRVFFSANGKNYRFQQYSASPIPANVVDDNGNLVNPYLITNGNCPEKTFRVIDGSDDFCGFDFVGELEIFPIRKRDAGFLSFTMNLGAHQAYADLLMSQSKQTSRIAPVPGSIAIPTTSPLFSQYLAPIGITQDTVAFYRLYDLGKRTSSDKADFMDFVAGIKGTVFKNWDYDAFYTHSQSKAASNVSGYPGALAISNLRKSGLLNPFVLAGQQTPAANAAIAAVNYNGYWNGGKSTLDTLNLRGSTELAKLPAGPLALAAGVNYNREKFQSAPSLFAQGLLADPVAGTLCDPNATSGPTQCDQRFGDAAATVPYSADRKNWGVFAELQIPIIKDLEVTLSARHDNYSDFGNTDNGKAAFRWKLSPQALIRGSVGTGFHAPTVPQVAAAPQPFGVTSDKYTCSAGLAAVAAANGAECRPGSQQYDVVAGGNPLLKPETSRQATIGFRVEPASWLSAGADFWWVAVKDVFGTLPEQSVFLDPTAYPGSWTSALDVGTGKRYVAFNAGNLNLGKSYSSGIDFDISSRTKTPFGGLDMKFNATYMLREVAQQVINGPYYSAIGDYGDNVGGVTFRVQGRASAALKTGAFTNTLAMNFKSGYKDATTTVEVLDAAGNVTGTEDVRIDVPWHYTFDWQTQWEMNKTFTFTIGALNLFNRKPPFAVSTGGVNRGQQFGYDDRYYDSRGRTWYVNATARF
ncbi:TonB-dependent receptor plug domain-containing protein [Ramlibacter sp. PS4R-6]|uniref:TonB-dependent receptor plug domain-containing protein n=1 Tax=Ramlibacter sp. PS4R-6 TaxID=3133438 RepID=UPI00309DC06A